MVDQPGAASDSHVRKRPRRVRPSAVASVGPTVSGWRGWIVGIGVAAAVDGWRRLAGRPWRWPGADAGCCSRQPRRPAPAAMGGRVEPAAREQFGPQVLWNCSILPVVVGQRTPVSRWVIPCSRQMLAPNPRGRGSSPTRRPPPGRPPPAPAPRSRRGGRCEPARVRTTGVDTLETPGVPLDVPPPVFARQGKQCVSAPKGRRKVWLYHLGREPL